MAALGKPWHPACFVCAACGRPINGPNYSKRRGKPYHPQCFHEKFCPRCARCGELIPSRGLRALGKDWHPACFVCEAGGEPLRGKSFYEHEGKPYCERHYQELFGLRCAAGGELIGEGPYVEKDGEPFCEQHYLELFGKRCAIGGEFLRGRYVVNSWGDAYCAKHARGLPQCFSCGRVICPELTGGGERYTDGRSMCDLCRLSAVDDVATGQHILEEVRATLAQLGLEIGPDATPLRLVDLKELSRRSEKPHTPELAGMACHRTVTQNGRIIERHVDEILILHGLPREHFAAVAAHELGHSFLFMNAFPELEPMVEEGLCELTQYLWLERQQTPEAANRIKAMEESDNSIYGLGFQSALRAMRRRPLPRLLSYVRKHRRFP